MAITNEFNIEKFKASLGFDSKREFDIISQNQARYKKILSDLYAALSKSQVWQKDGLNKYHHIYNDDVLQVSIMVDGRIELGIGEYNNVPAWPHFIKYLLIHQNDRTMYFTMDMIDQYKYGTLINFFKFG